MTTDHAAALRRLRSARDAAERWGDRLLALGAYLAVVAALGPVGWIVYVGATSYTRAALIGAALIAALAAGYALASLRYRGLTTHQRFQAEVVEAIGVRFLLDPVNVQEGPGVSDLAASVAVGLAGAGASQARALEAASA